jgi:5-methylcytosine-specific restriction endonuclease McrA
MPTKPITFEQKQHTANAQGNEKARNACRLNLRKIYGSAQWQHLRDCVLNEEPVCRECKRNPSTDVDHIRRLKYYPELAYTRDNLQGLCGPCHSKKTQAERGTKRP